MDIFKMSFSAAILIIAIVLVRAVALQRLPKQTFLVLWGVVALRLLIPFSIPSRFSVYTWLNTLPSIFGVTTTPAATNGMTVSPTDTGPVTAVMNVVGIDSIPAPTIALIDLVWLVGVVACACALFFAIAYIKCQREFQMSLPVTNDLITEWLQQHPLRRPLQIRQSDRIKVPLTYGVFRPVILLPAKTDWAEAARMRCILTHEYQHIRRFDTLTKLLLTATSCLHWFNPLVWFMYMLANRDIELACDEAVLRTLGEGGRSAYALTLIGLEETKARFTPLVSYFSKNAIEERIVSIMKTKKLTTVAVVMAVIVVVGLTTAFATSAVARNDDTTQAPVVFSDLDWVWPVDGYDRDRITTVFGDRVNILDGTVVNIDHIGIGGVGAAGANVYAVLPGIVEEVGFNPEQGNYIVLKHENEIQTSYWHLQDSLVVQGDSVAAGDTIGIVGSTGMATGPHLAFRLCSNRSPVNPLDYLGTGSR